ncbi:TlpA disulfide reductase family protein [Sphingobacterium spiritivorum]|uniref:TlpA disulfide reductase family protein n=1 Tax=Sphingobacterium spiritivorum TaxID=258 RepID=UPI0019194323|nr:TlpA disulfide reductase family protein [Sphingobacterium spiritivorum]QQT25109.1 AhpC/TSA family protein [Sphingobacterium spiritivorum]
MKQLYKLLTIFLFIVCYISVYGQGTFTITGYGQKIREGDSLFLSYKENGKFIQKSTTASRHKFTFTGSVKYPTKAYISRNQNPAYAYFITESIHLFLEPGKIEINSPDTLTGAVVSGTTLNETLQQFQNQQAQLKQKKRLIKDPDQFTESEKKDTALVNYNKRELEKLYYEEADNKLEFAKMNPNSYVSLDMLYDLSRINTYIFKVEEAYNILIDSLKQTEYAAIIRERIKAKKKLVPGMKAFDFSMKDVNGNTITLSEFKGKYVLLDFWASWCGPCRDEHPSLLRIYEHYKTRNFTILSVSIDTDKQKWTEAITKDKLLWTQVSDLNGNNSEVYQKYGITSIPANFLIAPDGTVIAKDLKGDFLTQELSKIFFKEPLSHQ